MIGTAEIAKPTEKPLKRFDDNRLLVGTFAGFPIYLHFNVLFLLIVLVIAFVSSGFHWQTFTNTTYFLGLVLPAIIIHEFSHAITARLLNFGNGSITIWLMGGYYIPDKEDLSPFVLRKSRKLHYILMILAGPLSNLALALITYLAYLPTQYAILLGIARVNFYLAVLNLIPIPPLDGGQIVTTFASFYFKRRSIFFAALLILITAFVVFAFIPKSDELTNMFVNYWFIFIIALIWITRGIITSDEPKVVVRRKHFATRRFSTPIRAIKNSIRNTSYTYRTTVYAPLKWPRKNKYLGPSF